MDYVLKKHSDDAPIEMSSTSEADTDVNLTRGSVKVLPTVKIYFPLNSLNFSSNVYSLKNFLGVSF